jgi:hypothetical protein
MYCKARKRSKGFQKHKPLFARGAAFLHGATARLTLLDAFFMVQANR